METLKKTLGTIAVIGAAAAVAGSTGQLRDCRRESKNQLPATKVAAAPPKLDRVRMTLLNQDGGTKIDPFGEISEYPGVLIFRDGDHVLFRQKLNGRFTQFMKWEFGNEEAQDSEVSGNWRDHLCDLKGNGQKRYLIFSSCDGGANKTYYDIYVIDAGDGFALLGHFTSVTAHYKYNYCFDQKIECDTWVCRYKWQNGSGLVFEFPDQIYFGGAMGCANLMVTLRFQKGREPEWGGAKAEFFPVGKYRNTLKSARGYDRDGVELFFHRLYCDLAAAGWMKHARNIAAEVGFTPEEIAKYDPEARKALRASKYYKYLAIFNEAAF